MNKESHTEKQLHELQTGVAEKHIHSEISSNPKMSDRVAALVARNLDTLLEELKENGVAMHNICRAAALGNPDDRDSKALFKYRNPEGSKPRNYISQASKYVRLAEAIADIKDHPYSGSSGELLRRVFSGTSYSPALTKSSDGAIALKVILDEVTSWIARQINLAQAYEGLQSLSPIGRKISVSRQFTLATGKLLNRPWRGCHLELGYQDTKVADDQGHPLVLKGEKGGLYHLCRREDISLFIGIDDDGLPRPYLAFEKSLVPTTKQSTKLTLRGQDRHEIWTVCDGVHEGSEFGELIFNTDQTRFYLPKETVARTVDLDRLGQNLQDAPFGSSYEQENPILTAFLHANPKYASHSGSCGKAIFGREYRTTLVTADTLEHVEVALTGHGGKYAPAGPGYIPFSLKRGSGKQLLHGDGILAEVIDWFTNGICLYDPDAMEKKFLGDDIQNSLMAPADGWISVRRYGSSNYHFWSAADLLWLRCKMLVMAAETEIVNATKNQRASYDNLLQRLRHSS